MFFKYFASKNQLPGFYIGGTLVENVNIFHHRNAIKVNTFFNTLKSELQKNLTMNLELLNPLSASVALI